MPALALLLALSLLTSAAIGTAAAAREESLTPLEEFSLQVERLQNSFSAIQKKIDDSAKSIAGLTEVEKARKEIDDLRGIVADLLGAVSDNGAVSELGAKALGHARDKLKSLEGESRFSREEQQYLLAEWRKLVEETERANEELGSARQEFVALLRMLQTREDFIDELMQIRRANEAIKVIRQLASDIRSASDALKNLIRSIKPPGV
jgi:predicted  nucleic acid-binding Zn-ribbon protein